ncbi:hypothetical protein SLEP1_g12238 [Rubroshorea leprosula]|uniref:Uncharacterized protein n=1 Tax=Rubroshorea leprosula TaxID=152421 RepID=A0AAV5IGB0_9ROSI|nr:hypothetical protein SLEP1_g12238 [Rubroshorea leprosula]
MLRRRGSISLLLLSLVHEAKEVKEKLLVVDGGGLNFKADADLFSRCCSVPIHALFLFMLYSVKECYCCSVEEGKEDEPKLRNMSREGCPKGCRRWWLRAGRTMEEGALPFENQIVGSSRGEWGKDESRSPKKESSPSPPNPPTVLRLDDEREKLTVTKTKSSEGERQREEKFQIDLMAPPPSRSSLERDGEIDFDAADPKSIATSVGTVSDT